MQSEQPQNNHLSQTSQDHWQFEDTPRRYSPHSRVSPAGKSQASTPHAQLSPSMAAHQSFEKLGMRPVTDYLRETHYPSQVAQVYHQDGASMQQPPVSTGQLYHKGAPVRAIQSFHGGASVTVPQSYHEEVPASAAKSYREERQVPFTQHKATLPSQFVDDSSRDASGDESPGVSYERTPFSADQAPAESAQPRGILHHSDSRSVSRPLGSPQARFSAHPTYSPNTSYTPNMSYERMQDDNGPARTSTPYRDMEGRVSAELSRSEGYHTAPPSQASPCGQRQQLDYLDAVYGHQSLPNMMLDYSMETTARPAESGAIHHQQLPGKVLHHYASLGNLVTYHRAILRYGPWKSKILFYQTKAGARNIVIIIVIMFQSILVNDIHLKGYDFRFYFIDLWSVGPLLVLLFTVSVSLP